MVETQPRTTGNTVGPRAALDGDEARPLLEDLTPVQIVAELDRYIIGQADAKRAVAVALRNRFRRQRLPDDMRQEVQPKNILMIGPTGVGKTEIARRVAKIVDAPFVKVEATKFTEVGYVGRDVESIIRDLVEVAISMLHGERIEQVKEAAGKIATERLVELLSLQTLQRSPAPRGRHRAGEDDERGTEAQRRREAAAERRLRRERQRVQDLLDQQALDEETVEIELDDDGYYDEYGSSEFLPGMTADDVQDAVQGIMEGLLARRGVRRRVSVREARRILTQQEANRMVDFDAVVEAAMKRVEEAAVVFIDEIDKTVSGEGEYGAEVSGAGVQRDLLPIVEGSVVMTRYGPVRTDHILFIAAGAFHQVRPADMIPELQGRFPIRVELQSLTEDDLLAILTEPRNALTKQYQALLGTEGLTLEFVEEGLREMARLATLVNARTEDIGARRLHTIIERVLEEVSFSAHEHAGETVTITAEFVAERVGDVAEDEDLSAFIL
ncbi:MAG: ATP-dependent protease ATPase subunit HslU [Chloroflexota bacterium]|nr:ATP-dependent protease ATPase subunit HslU [Chloroflexota bacterium]